MSNSKIKNILLALLIIGIISMTIAYAVIAQRLDIKSNTTVKSSKWSIKFDNLQKQRFVGSAVELSEPILTDTNIYGINVSLKKPGDEVVYTFDIVNSGDIEAIISTYQLTPGITCQDSNGSTTSLDATSVCNNVEYTLKYTNATQSGVPAGTNIAPGQILKAGESANVTLRIKYDMSTSYVPSSDIKVGGLDSYIIYVQN